MKPTIENLETINAVVDICIDRELYNTLLDGNMLRFSESAKKLLERIEELNPESKWDDYLAQQIVYEMYKVSRSFPTVGISLQPAVDWILSGEFTFSKDENGNWFFEKWSCLLWIKAIRAVLQKKNREPWISGFDDVVSLLEANVPRINPSLKIDKKTIEDQKKTIFAFLMELSASARDEASCGYAERARYLISDIADVTPEQRYEYGTSYDRWVWYNKGLSYQHSGLHHKAVMEFNYVISKFWKWVANEKDSKAFYLEFLFIVFPSILQRASISLQLQLGYHALQTLNFQESNEDKT